MPNQSLPKPSGKGKSRLLIFPETVESALRALNSRFCYIREGSRVAEIDRIVDQRIPMMPPTIFKTEAYPDLVVSGHRLAETWFSWPGRRIANRLVYEPAQPRFTPTNDLNIWFPSTIAPIEGDISLWTHFIDSLFKSDPTYKQWFLAWLAYPLQHPGAKLSTACLIWSKDQGNGKSTLGWIMRQLYGRHNSAEIKEGDIGASFNPWAAAKQFIVIDEMHGRNAAKKMDELKSMITRTVATVNEKYTKQYEVRDTLNYLFTSNHADAFALDSQDRRFFVQNVDNNGLDAEWFHSTFFPWLNGPGLSAIYHHLLHDIDLSKPVAGGNPFSPNPAPFKRSAPAPRTKDRTEMIRAARTDGEAWLDDLIESPENYPEFAGRTLFTPKELWHASGTKMDLSPFSRHVAARLFLVGSGNPIRLEANLRTRLYSTTSAHREMAQTQIRELWHTEHGTCPAAD